jgi:hypothetical protein
MLLALWFAYGEPWYGGITPIPPEPEQPTGGGSGGGSRGYYRPRPDPITFRHGMADDWGRIPKNIAVKTLKAKAVAKDTRKQVDVDYLALGDLMLYELTAQQMLMQEQINMLKRMREEDEEIAILLTLGVL